MDTPTTPPIDLGAIQARLKAADEVHSPVTRWELRCAHGLTIASTTKSPPEGWIVNGGRAQMCSECDDDEAEDFPAASFVHSWTSQAHTEDKMSKEDVRVLLTEVRRLTDALAATRLDGARAMREAAKNVAAEEIDRAPRGVAKGVAMYITDKIDTLDPAAVVGSGS